MAQYETSIFNEHTLQKNFIKAYKIYFFDIPSNSLYKKMVII